MHLRGHCKESRQQRIAIGGTSLRHSEQEEKGQGEGGREEQSKADGVASPQELIAIESWARATCYSTHLIRIMLFIPYSYSAKHRKLSSLFYIQTKGGPEGLCNLCGVGGRGHKAVQRPALTQAARFWSLRPDA